MNYLWPLLRAKSALFESQGRLRSREYLEPCLLLKTVRIFLAFQFNIFMANFCYVNVEKVGEFHSVRLNSMDISIPIKISTKRKL